MNAPSLLRVLSLAVPLALASIPGPALAVWQPDGTPLSPQPLPLQSYGMRGLVADGADGAFTVWQFGQTLPDFSGTNFALAAQRVNVLGNRPAGWAASGSNILTWLDSNSSGIQFATPLPLLPDGPGGAIAPLIVRTFIAESVNRFQLYRFTPGGAIGMFPGFSGLDAGYPVLDATADVDGSGGVIMMGWQQTFAPPIGTPPPGALFVQRINSSGIALWPAPSPGPGPYPGLEIVPGPNVAAGGIAALSDGAGGGFFAWLDVREVGDPDVYVQHIDGTGAIAAGWPAGGVQVCGAAGGQFEPHLAPDGAAGVIVVWRDERDGTSHLHANRVLASGTPAPGIPVDGRLLPSSDLSDAFVNLASDGQGGCFLVREGLTLALVGISHLYRLDAAMQTRAGWPAEGMALNTLSPGAGAVGLVADALGGAFVSYRNGFGSVAPEGLYAQHFAADGSLRPGWTSDGYRLGGHGQDSRMVPSGGGAIVGWNDDRPGWVGVYAQRLADDGPVPVELTLVNASAEPGRVSLRWFAAGGAGLRVAVERRTEASDWTSLAEAATDGTGYIAYEDRAVEPGSRYGYRLSWLEGGVTRVSRETWIAVPHGTTFALESPRPNPAVGRVSVGLTLPDARGARLDVLDLAGRRVISRDLAGLGAGRHVVTLDEAGALAPGVYTLRLAQGGAAKLTRLCVMR